MLLVDIFYNPRVAYTKIDYSTDNNSHYVASDINSYDTWNTTKFYAEEALYRMNGILHNPEPSDWGYHLFLYFYDGVLMPRR